MPSLTLLSLLRAGRVVYASEKLLNKTGHAHETFEDFVDFAIANAGELHLLRFDEVVKDMIVEARATNQTLRRVEDLYQLPRIAVPFHHLWMEAVTPGGHRVCCLSNKYEDEAGAYHIRLLTGVGCAYSGQPVVSFPMGMLTVSVRADGKIIGCLQGTFFDETKDQKLMQAARGVAFIACHAFARLGCKNVQCVPMAGQWKPKKKNQAMPFSIWHEIRVQAIPARGQSKEPSGEHRQIRHHWVRGHFADYTGGKGLFGKYRDVFWVPEFTRGDYSLGSVRQTHVVGSNAMAQ